MDTNNMLAFIGSLLIGSILILGISRIISSYSYADNKLLYENNYCQTTIEGHAGLAWQKCKVVSSYSEK